MEITLRAARINCGLTLQDVSKQIGVSVNSLSAWERYKVFPTIDRFKQLCRLYGVNMDDVYIPDPLLDE